MTTRSKKRGPAFPRGRKFVPPKVAATQEGGPPAELVVAKEPATVETLTRDIIEVLDQVDGYMAIREGRAVDFSALWQDRGTLGELRKQMNALVEEYEGLAAAADGGLQDDDPLHQLISAEPGQIPTWARAGSFIVWLGIVPVLCRWGGFVFPCSFAIPADPDMVFMPESRLPTRIADDTVVSVLDHFRRGLDWSVNREEWVKNKRVKTFRLEQLTVERRQATAEYLGRQEWLRRALDRGPVDAMPLPKQVKSVQLAL